MSNAPKKAFASQADLQDKKITFEQLSKHCWAYTAEGDPNSGVIIGDRYIMVSDATATPAMAQDLIAKIRTVSDKTAIQIARRASARTCEQIASNHERLLMTPEVLILLGAAPASVGTALNDLRARLVKAVLTDQALIELAGPNGRVRYTGCTTHLGHGRSMEAAMGIQFSVAYVLRPEQL